MLYIVSNFQYSLITNALSLSIAVMGAGFLFLLFSRAEVNPKYRTALLVSALVPAIACYHYVRIYESFIHAYQYAGGMYQLSGVPFNAAYRYADWIITVPMLLIELVAVLALSSSQSTKLTMKLAFAALLMILLGYPGEIASDPMTRTVFGIAGTIPFLYIIGVLFTEFSRITREQYPEVQGLITSAKWLVVVTWCFYPIAYSLPLLGITGSVGETGLQIGYTIADITAKVGLGLLIYFIAAKKTAIENRS
jgi:bacteriorhodopsin